jgi:two-component system KDP operon response regulator KdpE
MFLFYQIIEKSMHPNYPYLGFGFVSDRGKSVSGLQGKTTTIQARKPIQSKCPEDYFMRVLVIDDDPAMTDLLRLILQSTTALVLTANSGQEGIRLAQTKSPDIILLDLMMPDVDGWATCNAIRQFSQAPIIILSALDSPGVVAQALDAGADDYIIKPVTACSLIAHINKALRRNYIQQGLTPVLL